MPKSRLIAVLLVLPLLVAVGPTVATDNTTPQSPASPRYSPEKLARIRQALVAQIAVREAAENAMRAPTPAEAAQLASSPAAPADPITLTGGGVGLRSDASQASFVIAETAEDGTVRLTHDSPSRVAPSSKGGAHVR